MQVSVIICTYSFDLYDAFADAVESVLTQTYDDVEIIVVVDGDPQLYDQIIDEYEGITVHLNKENVGLSESRNRGIGLANGDIIAFLDDDAVADSQWIETLVTVYEENDAIAAGGKMVPNWIAGRPSFLPEEFYWLIGVTHRGFARPGEEVRNTFGSNISFRREVFDEIGTFDPELGRHGSANFQAEETVFAIRMRERFGQGVIYEPNAKVAHKVFEYRTNPMWLLDRAFWQGYSKRVLEDLVDNSGEGEGEFLAKLLTEFVPKRICRLIKSPSRDDFLQLIAIFVFTGTVGVGYLYGVIKQITSK